MPVAQEKALKAVAAHLAKSGKLKKRKGDTSKEARDRFVYGVMRKSGWKPRRERG
jgi:hypothetical protein